MPIFILILFRLFWFSSSVEAVVKEFHSKSGEDAELAFIKKYEEDENPSIQAYVIAYEMRQAEHAFNPITKLQIFKNSKVELEELVSKNRNNIHVRYIRLLIQEKTPSILNYDQNIEVDKTFLNNKISNNTCPDYLVGYIKSNTSL